MPGCAVVNAYGLNDNGDVVGWASGSSTWSVGSGGFVKKGDTIYQVVVPGCRFVTAYDVNNNGVVVGSCSDNRGDHGFIATPK